ncbi:hypothetical protein IHE46_15445 [Rhodanobacter sp. DHG33]|nr:hypothetical protein [Rhodanobacter sp. DHG33]
MVRLLRLRRLGDLGALHDGWAGWMVNGRTGELVSPSGYTFQPLRLANWTVVYAQARLWQEDYERRTAGGVGALAPARPQAVTLQPEVWEARVVTEALPSPPIEAIPQLTAFLALGRVLERVGFSDAFQLHQVERGDHAAAGERLGRPPAAGSARDVIDLEGVEGRHGCLTGAEMAQWRGLATVLASACTSPRDGSMLSVWRQNPEFVTDQKAPTGASGACDVRGPESNTGLNLTLPGGHS